MIECGFADEMRRESIRLKSSEWAGDVVWSIQRLQPKDFIDLMKKTDIIDYLGILLILIECLPPSNPVVKNSSTHL